MKRALDTRQLEAFAAVMAAGTITGAAELLDRSQPAVTRQIQELETDLGFELLRRNGRRVTPTERGTLFHVEVERHLVGLQNLRDRAEAIRQGNTAVLAVAAISALAAGLLPLAIAEITGDRAIRTHLRSTTAEEVVQLVLARVADVGVSSVPIRHPRLEVHWIAEMACVAVLPADDPLAAEPVIALRALAERRLITTANPYRLRSHVDEALRTAGLSRHQPIDTNTSINAMGAVRAGLGIAIIEPVTPASMPVNGLVTRAIDARIPFAFGAVTLAGRPVSPLVRALIASVRTIAGRLLPDLRDRAVGEPEDDSGGPGIADRLPAESAT